MERLTAKLDGKCVIMLPSGGEREWCIGTRKVGDVTIQYLSGDAADYLAAYEYAMPLERVQELAQADQAGRLVVLPQGKAQWLKAILDERERQDQKWGVPNENTFCEWGSILAEEAGELCKELNELNFGRGDPEKMETEAVQVAAVALSILEQFCVAHNVTVQVAVALGRLARPEAEAAVEKGADT